MSAGNPRIVFLDAATYGDISLQAFTDRWDCTIHAATAPEETIRRLASHSVAVINKVAIDRTVLEAPAARDLELVAVAATGTDVIDKETAARSGVKVCNVPGYATQSVAQFTIGLILELATRIGGYAEAVKCGDWQKSPVFTFFGYPSVELSGKKLGIIGYGNIGRAVAQMARGLGLEILVGARPGNEDPLPADRVPLDRLLRESDIVSLHCPLTPGTANLIDQKALSSMKPTAFLINTARGALVDEAALISALRENTIAAAALDVITQEPPPADHAIVRAAKGLNNLIVTPHTAWSTREARARLLEEVLANIEAFLAGEVRNIVT